ncbi:MAG: TIGR03757 family integrating conjugative element protein [Pseudomonadota bacterium]
MADYHRNSLKGWYVALSVIVAFGLITNLQANDAEGPVIEAFVGNIELGLREPENTTVYNIERIAHLQQALSKDLPSDPEKAKKLVLDRFQQIDTQLSHELENAANGLVQAMQYGIDRYPAIVFDGKAVVYGITDIRTATQVYRQWQAGEARP